VPTYSSDAFGVCQVVVASRFVQVTPANTSSAAYGVCQFEVSSALENVTPPVVTPPSGGGGTTPPVDPGAGVIRTVQAGIPDGPFRGRGAKPRVTGRGG
jgi:hypothetical protein